MADQGTEAYWGEKHRPFVPAWTNDAELAELADAIVRGASVCHAVVPDLRQLIEPVQAHPDARLAEIGSDGKPTISDPTQVEIRGGEAIRCDCSALTIAVRLRASMRFTGGADFGDATFTGDAVFDGATFTGGAVFRRATFSGGTVFWEATFTGGANFMWVTFATGARFERARFTGDVGFLNATFDGGANFVRATFRSGAHFGLMTFGGDADFRAATFSGDTEFGAMFAAGACFGRAIFAGGADFGNSTFTKRASFGSITLERRLLLHHVQIEDDARLSFANAYLRPGSEITLPHDRLRHERLHDPLSNGEARWFDESDLDPDQQGRRIRMWFIQYCRVAIVAPIIEVDWPWLRRTLGMNSRGTFIEGEDSDDPEKLRIAAAQYNLFRNNFRNQPAADELEDHCHHRYMDLRRKAGDFWLQSHPWRLIRWGVNAFYWLIWRNCLGYLVQPMRPFWTGLIIILLGWAIYHIGVRLDPATIIFNGPVIEGLTAEETAMRRWREGALTPLYFSITTFTTLGYGDFAPTGWLRAVAGAQALLGVALIALFTVSWGRKMIR